MSEFDFNSNIRANLEQDGFTDGRTVGITRDMIDDLFAEGLGGIYTAATRAFRGINHYNTGAALPANYDLHGYTFFTRPRMKLSDKNLTLDRSLLLLANENPLSIPRAVRAYLDPIGSGSPAGFSVQDPSVPKKKYSSPLVDPYFPFISILSNTMTSLTGWPDVNVDTYTEQQGIQKEQWSMYDGIVKVYSTFDLNASFVNMRGDPLGLMFYIWSLYGTLAKYDEDLIPWIDSILDREKDYETRIYRLVMDPTKTYVQKIASTIGFPTAANTGASFDYDAQKPVNNKQDTISMSFKCQGAMYYDPYTACAFNITVVDFNPNMFPPLRARLYTKIPPYQRKFFKDEGYPWINLDTSELEWYVPNERYAEVIESIR